MSRPVQIVIYAVVVALIASGFMLGCETGPEQTSTPVEPEQGTEAGEPTLQDEMQMTRLMELMHDRRAEMVQLYGQLDASYEVLERAERLDRDLSEHLVEMRAYYAEIREQHREMERHYLELRSAVEDRARIIFAQHRRGHGEGRAEMMHDHDGMQEMATRHAQMANLHEAMATLNRATERMALAAHHEELVVHHEEMEQMSRDMSQLMGRMGIGARR